MTKNNVFVTLVVIFVVVGMPFLAACQPTSPVQAMAVAPESEVSADFDYDQAAENMAFRWIAMARAYEKHGLLNNRSDPDDIMAYRWNAMAKAYERQGLLNYSSNPDDVLAYRWLATAKGYERLGLLNDKMNSGDVKAFRWLATAKAYERLGLLNDK